MTRSRIVKPVLPVETGVRDGLAYTLWLPERDDARGGVVILHGASSCKESHHDFARAAIATGLAAVAFDARGHGSSEGALDGRAVADVGTMVSVLRSSLGDPGAPVALRGSSMGGYFALAAAAPVGAAAVVAICPASGEGLRRGLAAGRFSFPVRVDELDALLARFELFAIVPELSIPVLLMHAEGDEVVPVEQSRELAPLLAHPASRLIAVPGGHHRSIQHDAELQAVALRFIARAVG